MAVCCYVEGVAVCLLIIVVSITAQDDREDYLNNYGTDEENDTPILNEFLQNVQNHKDDFTWIERRAKTLNLPDIGKYEKDIEPRIRRTQLAERSRRKPINDFSYLDSSDNDYEDAVQRTYRRVPGGFHGRLRRRNRLLNRNRNKRGTHSALNYDYEANMDDVQVSPESQYGVLHVPGDKYGYNSKKIYRRYMQEDLRSPFFSDPSDQDTIVIDDTLSKSHHDILGLKKYRDRNRKKIAEKDYDGLKLYKKRSINRLSDSFPFKPFDFILKPVAIPDTKPDNKPLQQNSPFNNLSLQMSYGPYANIINDAVGINIRNYDERRHNSNTSRDEERIDEIPDIKDCGVKLPINSHFEGLMYPNIHDIIGNMSDNKNVPKNAPKESAPTSSETAVVAKNLDNDLVTEETTSNVNSLYDVTHPTSAIEQRILATNNDMLDQDISTSTVTNNNGKRDSESPGFDKLYFSGENEDQRIIGKSVPNNAFRVKGSKPPNKVEDVNKNSKYFTNLLNDQRKETENLKSIEYNEGYDDYSYNEQNYKRAPSENFNTKHEVIMDKKTPSDLKDNVQFHTRHLLNLENRDCSQKNHSLCSEDKKREPPNLSEMSNEEDYKDDDIMGKQLLKKSTGEGEDDYANADPYIGKKVKYMNKKKENKSRGAKNVHVVGKLEQEPSNKLTKVPIEEITKEEEDIESRINDDEKDEARNIKLCGSGKNKVYCNMKDEKEDDNFASNLKLIKGHLKKKYSGFSARQPDSIIKEEGKHDDANDFYLSKIPAAEDIDFNQKSVDGKVKVVQMSEVINPPQIMEGKPYDVKKSPVNENDDDQTYSEHIVSEIVPQAPEEKNSMLSSRNMQEQNNLLEMREESNQDIIEAGFKKKLGTSTDIRLKRRNKLRNYLDKLRLNKKRKSNVRRDQYHKPQNNNAQSIPQKPKYEIDFLEPSDQEDVSIRKQRSYDQPYNLQYPSAILNRRNSVPAVNVVSNTTESQTRVPVVQHGTEEATEVYPANTKAPFQYIEYPKDKPQQITSSVNTEVAAAIVDQIFEAINANSELGSSLGRGLCKQAERQKNIQDLTNIDRNSTKTDLKDTQNILQSLMVAINKIIEEKVKSRLCRILPLPLQNYLKTIVKIPKPHDRGGDASSENLPLPQIKTREAVEDHPEAEQADFLFYKENNETPEIKRHQIKYKMRIIKSLLDEYRQMSGKCKVKMRFVRDYLEKNFAILQALYEKCQEEETYKSQKASQQKQKKHTAHPKGSKDNGSDSQRSIDEQLGWEDRNDKVLTDFDVDKIVRQSMGKEKREAYSGSNENRSASKQYKTLVNAIEKIRMKQAKEEKLAKLFGDKRSMRNENYETIKSNNKEAQDIGHFSFKEPVVFMDN